MITLRHALEYDWDAVAKLIYESTNHWYQSNGKSAIFQGDPSSTRLFCEVYEALDPGKCLLAVDADAGSTETIVGSCFYHPRETHVSLGIMNSHPDYAVQGVAKQLLRFILDFADEQDKERAGGSTASSRQFNIRAVR